MPRLDETGLDPTAAGFFAKELELAHASDPERQRTPWGKWAYATASAKAGRFEPVRRLFDLYDAEPYDPVLNRACAEVLGLAGDRSCIQRARDELASPKQPWHYELHIDLSLCLAYHGTLRDALVILTAYKRLTKVEDAAAMPVFIHMLLGDDDDDDDVLFPDSPEELDLYEESVRCRVEQVAAEVGGEEVRVFAGRALTIRHFTEQFIAAARTRGEVSPRWRLRFEAYTGIDCRHFYRRGRFQRLAALATLEEFLEGPAVARFADERRYFFGHAVA